MAKFKFTSARDKKLKIISCAKAAEGAGILKGAHIELISNKEITVDGCKGISEYNSEYVKLKTVDGYISLFGSNLRIPVFEGPVITVCGFLSAIEFNVR